MVFAGERCFKLYRIMFIAMGLWPYQKLHICRLQAVSFFILNFSLFISQFIPFLTSICDMDCVLKRFSYIFITMAYVLNYYSFYFNSANVKQILEHLQFDWKMFGNNDGIKIFEEYLSEAYIFSLFLYMSLFVGVFAFVIFECRSIILDNIIPLNESRPRKLEVDMQLFISEEQYFFPYLVQEILGILIGLWTVITIGTFMTTVGKHCCATYKIASCLIENMVTVHTLKIPVAERMQFMFRSICLSVHIHRRTLEFIKYMMLSFNLWYCPLLLVSVLFLSCILFRFYSATIMLNDFYDIVISSLILCCSLLYAVMANFLAQSYTDHSGKILEDAYNSFWYIAPLPIQKLLLIIQKSVRCHKLIMGGIFALSIEGFSTIITSAISYFTFIYAVRT